MVISFSNLATKGIHQIPQTKKKLFERLFDDPLASNQLIEYYWLLIHLIKTTPFPSNDYSCTLIK